MGTVGKGNLKNKGVVVAYPEGVFRNIHLQGIAQGYRNGIRFGALVTIVVAGRNNFV